MAFLQKTWKDRVAEYINRRVLTKEDGTTELVSVERSEGTISQEGDAFSAANMNDLEQRIANEFSEQNKKLVNLVKEGTFTATTDSYGRISAGDANINVNEKFLLGYYVIGYITDAYLNNDATKYGFFIKNGDGSLLKNTNVQVYYHYIER